MRFASAVDLSVLFEHPVKARLRGQVLPQICQPGHDLRRRQAGVFGSVAHLHNRLLFLRRERLQMNTPTGGLAAPVTELVAWLAQAPQCAAAAPIINMENMMRTTQAIGSMGR